MYSTRFRVFVTDMWSLLRTAKKHKKNWFHLDNYTDETSKGFDIIRITGIVEQSKGDVSESLHPLTFLYKIITIKIFMKKVFNKNHNQNFLKNNKYFNS